MAKYECELQGDMHRLLDKLDAEITGGSISASREECSDFQLSGVTCAVRVYERYSWSGGNRLSLNITLLSDGERIFCTAITSGGSQAMFFKFNTFGEDAFLNKVCDIIERWQHES